MVFSSLIFNADVHCQGGEVCALNRLLKEQHGILQQRCRCPRANLNLSGRNQGITNGGRAGRFLTSSHTRCRSRRSCDRTKTPPRRFMMARSRCHSLIRRLAVNGVTFAAFANSSFVI